VRQQLEATATDMQAFDADCVPKTSILPLDLFLFFFPLLALRIGVIGFV